MKKILFRCEANSETGLGHFFRCLEAARNIQNESFINFHFQGNFNSFSQNILKSEKISFTQLSKINDFTKFETSEEFDLLVVDSYFAGQKYYDSLNGLSWGVFDDFADLKFKGAKFVVNFRLQAEKMYSYLSDEQLLGTTYFPVNKNFRKLRSQQLKKQEGFKNILIFIGGSDLHNVGHKLAVILRNQFPGKNINWIDSGSIKIDIPGVTKWPMLDDFSKGLEGTDLFITGGGRSKYESCFSCVPTLVCSQTPEQESDTEILDKHKVIGSLGTAYEFNENKVISKLDSGLDLNELRFNCKEKFFEESSENFTKKILNYL